MLDTPTRLRRRRFHQRTFLLAGIYNLIWGAWTGLDPQWLFRMTGMELINQLNGVECLMINDRNEVSTSDNLQLDYNQASEKNPESWELSIGGKSNKN